MPSDINETIAEVLRLDAKATPGPWVRTRTGATMAVAGCGGSRGGVYTLAESAYPSMSADLIAYYRTAAPVLAREVQRLRLDHADECLGSCCEGYNLGYDDGRRAGQEAMRERAAAVCVARYEEHEQRLWAGPPAERITDRVGGMADEAQQCAEAIRALEVE